jgi:cytochrome b561
MSHPFNIIIDFAAKLWRTAYYCTMFTVDLPGFLFCVVKTSLMSYFSIYEVNIAVNLFICATIKNKLS